MNFITPAIPFFFVLIIVESLFSWKKQRDFYRLNDSISNLSCGILDRLVSLSLYASLFGLFVWLHTSFALIEVNFVLAFLLYDLAYYIFHRTSHRVNLVWGAHIVHHNSEEYNLSVALRQGPFQGLASFWFYLPLALVMTPKMYVTVSSINTVYQFFIHTRFVGKLGVLEWVMNTPSHHRVHHAKDPKYWDKNYAGVFIIWDRLFGTFKEEKSDPHYGVAVPIESFNPLWSVFHWWVSLFKRTLKIKGLKNKILLWLKYPGWMAPCEGRRRLNLSYEKYDPKILGLQRYIKIGLFLFSNALTLYLLNSIGQLTQMWLIVYTFFICLFLILAATPRLKT